MTKISANIVGYGVNTETGSEIYTFELTFPRFILAELNTHRAFSRNSASSRAIPFNKMVESVEKDPFIPVAWQIKHKGMQGTEYFDHQLSIAICRGDWLVARDAAVYHAKIMYNYSVTKQLCNRLLEPFMWHKVIVTTTLPGLKNFFDQRCPVYEVNGWRFNSRVQAYNWLCQENDNSEELVPEAYDDLGWLKLSKSGAEIHMQLLAEAMFDEMHFAKNGATELQRLPPGYWYYPYKNKVDLLASDATIQDRLKIAMAMCAHFSYTTIGEERTKTAGEWLAIYEKLAGANPPHWSPMEHVAQATRLGYDHRVRNLKDFVQWRTYLELK